MEYEWRWRKFKERPRKFPRPRWDGSDLSGKTILLHAEQGLGDTIQFVRYARELKRQNARVILACQEPLVRLLSLSEICDMVVARGPKLPKFDLHAPLLSLPTILRTTVETIPADVPYLRADEQRVTHWRDVLATTTTESDLNLGERRRRVAIAWQGSPTFTGDRHRSIAFRYFAGLVRARPDIQFISLQKQHVDAATADEMKELGILSFDEMDEDAGAFMDTAAIIRNVDLVITSDTSIPHLAGALGAPVWLLLSAVPDWRWFLEGDNSPWYPTMRIFRSHQRGCWKNVFSDVARMF